jgi:hypothetical protein
MEDMNRCSNGKTRFVTSDTLFLSFFAAAKGAADDEEGWALGLTAQEFWMAADTFLQAADSNACEALARLAVRQRGAATLMPLAGQINAKEDAAGEQTFVFIGKQSGSHFILPAQHVLCFNWTGSQPSRHTLPPCSAEDTPAEAGMLAVGIAGGAAEEAAHVVVDCRWSDDALPGPAPAPLDPGLTKPKPRFRAPIPVGKRHRHHMIRFLPRLLPWARVHLNAGRTVVIVDEDGEDRAPILAVALLSAFWTDDGARLNAHGEGARARVEAHVAGLSKATFTQRYQWYVPQKRKTLVFHGLSSPCVL